MALIRKHRWFLFVGKVYNIFHHDHRVDHLIQAMAHLPEMHLALLSITTPNSVQQIKDWAEKFFVQDRVHILNPVPYSQLLGYIKDADVGVYAMPARCLNIEYSMPNKLFEYGLAGIPLAVSRLKDACAFVEELNIGESFDPSSVKDLRKSIENVYKNRTRYQMEGHRLRSAQQKYGWEAQGVKLRRLYKAVLDGSNPAHRGMPGPVEEIEMPIEEKQHLVGAS